MKITLIGLISLVACGNAVAGPYAPAAGKVGSTAVSKSDPSLIAWATAFTNYAPGSNVDAAFRTPQKALGAAVGDSFDIVSLGNGGKITLTFAGTLFNGPGYDFAVFENGFSDTFLELAFVEVSSDGMNFFRFPSFSFTPSAVGAFGSVDPTNIDGLAGKYRQGFGTPFDFDIFRNAQGIDVNRISHIRLVDVIGNGTEFDSFPASFGGPHPIFDPFPTSGSAGFDLDAIGVRYLNAIDPNPPSPIPLPPALGLFALASGALALCRRESNSSFN